MRQRRLEVWTTRITPRLDDRDFLDITRQTAEKYEKAARWAELDFAERRRRRTLALETAVARTRLGITLPLIQGHALDDGLPSLGAPFAPSWSLLMPTKSGLELADRHGDGALRLPPEHRERPLTMAIELEANLWQSYREGWVRENVEQSGFDQQMRESYSHYRRSWEWALDRHRLVIGCLCDRPAWWPDDQRWEHCHRFLVAEQLRACGATYRGEVPPPPEEPSPQIGLFLG